MIQTGFIGGAVGYRLLRYLSSHVAWGPRGDGSAYRHRSKVETLLGKDIWTALAGKVVMDFGCGIGAEAVEIAQRGARRVIGIDIQEPGLELARLAAEQAGVSDRCLFTTRTDERADVILSIDGFEHYTDPNEILHLMSRLVKPDGCAYLAFGPPWFHPLGGHLFSLFPWGHLIFTEQALIRWRSDFKSDGATRFCEVQGGLNQMTIRRFKKCVQESEFKIERLDTVPIRGLRRLSNVVTQEFVTSTVRCKLTPRAALGNGSG